MMIKSSENNHTKNKLKKMKKVFELILKCIDIWGRIELKRMGIYE